MLSKQKSNLEFPKRPEHYGGRLVSRPITARGFPVGVLDYSQTLKPAQWVDRQELQIGYRNDISRWKTFDLAGRYCHDHLAWGRIYGEPRGDHPRAITRCLRCKCVRLKHFANGRESPDIVAAQ